MNGASLWIVTSEVADRLVPAIFTFEIYEIYYPATMCEDVQEQVQSRKKLHSKCLMDRYRAQRRDQPCCGKVALRSPRTSRAATCRHDAVASCLRLIVATFPGLQSSTP